MGKTGLILIPVTAAFAVVLAGCAMTETPPPGSDPGPGADTCGSAAWAYLIGQPRASAEGAGLPSPHRIYRRGDPVTMDYAPQRLNVEIDPNSGRVERIACG